MPWDEDRMAQPRMPRRERLRGLDVCASRRGSMVERGSVLADSVPMVERGSGGRHRLDAGVRVGGGRVPPRRAATAPTHPGGRGPDWRARHSRTVRWWVRSSRPTTPPAALPSGRRPRRVYSPPVGPRDHILRECPGPSASRRGDAIHPVGPVAPPQGCRGERSRIDNSVQALVGRLCVGDTHSIGWRFGKDVAGAPGDRYSGLRSNKDSNSPPPAGAGTASVLAGPRARTCKPTPSGKLASGRRRRPAEGRTRWRSR